MIGRLGEYADAADYPAGIERRRKQRVLKQAGIHVMRAAKCGQCPSWLEQLKRPQMYFLVAAQGIRHRRAVARE